MSGHLLNNSVAFALSGERHFCQRVFAKLQQWGIRNRIMLASVDPQISGEMNDLELDRLLKVADFSEIIMLFINPPENLMTKFPDSIVNVETEDRSLDELLGICRKSILKRKAQVN